MDGWIFESAQSRVTLDDLLPRKVKRFVITKLLFLKRSVQSMRTSGLFLVAAANTSASFAGVQLAAGTKGVGTEISRVKSSVWIDVFFGLSIQPTAKLPSAVMLNNV